MKIISFCLVIAVLSIKLFAIENLPNPYNTVDKIRPLDMHGWFSPENKTCLKKIITTQKITTIIEVGSWLGVSTIFMASLIKNQKGIVYAVDHWQGQYYWENPGSEITSRIENLYEQFLSNVIHHKLTDVIVPIKAPSLDAAKILDVFADLIYIDASHKENDVYNDIMAWNKKLTPNGIMCGDDWLSQEVKNGVIHAAFELNKKILNSGNFWYLQ